MFFHCTYTCRKGLRRSAEGARNTGSRTPCHRSWTTEPVPLLTGELYQSCIECSPRGVVTVLLLSDVRELVAMFSETVGQHKHSKTKYFHASLAARCVWFVELLNRANLKSSERQLHDYWKVWTVLAIFGSRKQFTIFPDFQDSNVCSCAQNSTEQSELCEDSLEPENNHENNELRRRQPPPNSLSERNNNLLCTSNGVEGNKLSFFLRTMATLIVNA